MTEEQAPAEDAAPEIDDREIDDSGSVNMSQWEFIDRVPTREEVIELLETLPEVYGVKTVDFADYVQGLPARKKVERKDTMPNGRVVIEDEWHDSYAIYMSVAGRVKMAEAIAAVNCWTLDFVPEPQTPTGVPGLIQMGDGRIVYREYVEFTQAKSDEFPWTDGGTFERFEPGTMVGRKPGMAWVPYSGGKQAAGSNPYEKVETSARGRALGAWGIGVLPGSGIASLEEMLGIAGNRAAMAAADRGEGGQQQSGGRPSREEMLEQALTLQETLRQRRRMSEEEMVERTGTFLRSLGIKSVYDEESHTIDWQKVKDGQVQLLINSMVDSLRTLDAQENPL